MNFFKYIVIFLSILILINCTPAGNSTSNIPADTIRQPIPSLSPTPVPTPAFTLGPLESVYRGLYLKEYQSTDRSTYFSDSVPHELVIDLHNHVSETAAILNSELESSLDHYADLYLIEDTESFDKVRKFLNIDSGGFQPAGFFIAACNPNPIAVDTCYGGIYADLSTGDYSW